jgi:hypothetical protein
MDRLCCNSGYLKNTQRQHIHRQTHPDDWQVNAAAASCRLNLNTRRHVWVLHMHKAQISAQRPDNLQAMLKRFPQTHQAPTLSKIGPCTSSLLHCVLSYAVPYNINTEKFNIKHIKPTSVSGSLLDSIIITKTRHELQDTIHTQLQQTLHNISHCSNCRKCC